jgi:cyclic dehypoxanthinyl futalosine synthase
MDLQPSGRPVQQILDDALAGRRISAGDAHTLILDGDLLDLGLAAHEVRNRFNDPAVATYNIDRNINYTNVCVYKCRFCAFYREPGDPEGYLLPFEEIGRKVEETLALNGTGILMQGGVHPDLPLSYYEDLLRYLRSSYPTLHVHAFSPPEVKFIAKKERMSFYDVIARLKAAGLMSIPGGGAEILSDVTRKEVLAYPKCSAEEWIDVMRQAHRNGLRTSATMMYGMGEPLTARVEHFQRVRDLQDETAGFSAFISWTFQHDHTDMPDVPETYAEEYLRTLAVSRLFLDNIVHFQTSWVTQGKKIGQASLGFGADDMGSIMIEENVVASAGTAYRMSQDEMEHLISSAGYIPKQRTNLYERIVTRADTAEMARKYRGSLTPQNRDLVSSALLPVLGLKTGSAPSTDGALPIARTVQQPARQAL